MMIDPRPLPLPPCQRGLRILLRAAEMHGMTARKLVARKRTTELARARFAAMLAMKRNGIHLCAIARRMERTHKTVSHGIEQAARLCEEQPGYADLVDELVEAGAGPVGVLGQ